MGKAAGRRETGLVGHGKRNCANMKSKDWFFNKFFALLSCAINYHVISSYIVMGDLASVLDWVCSVLFLQSVQPRARRQKKPESGGKGERDCRSLLSASMVRI